MIIEPGVNIGAGIGLFSDLVAAVATPSNQLTEETLAITPFNPISPIPGTGRDPYGYFVVSGPLPDGMSIDENTGTVSGTPTTASVVDVTFGVRDRNNFVATVTSTVNFTIYPRIIATTTITTQFLEVGTVMTNYRPLTAAGGNGLYTYYVDSGTLPAGLTLNTTTGTITGTPTASYSTGSVTFAVRDSFGVIAVTTATVDFTVYPRITAVASTTTQRLEVGLAMTTFVPLVASNGNEVYTYALASGSVLPSGITLNPSTGQVTGTPTSSTFGTANVIFVVRDGLGIIASTTSTVSFTVYPTISATVDTTALSVETTFPVTPFRPLIAAGGSGTYTYYISSGTLNSGLTLNASTGYISGTPTSSGTTVVVSVKDSLDVVATTTSTLVLSVYIGITATANTTAQRYEVGTAISFTPLVASSGLAPYTYSILSGSLPAGITLNASTGLVSGTPTASYSSTNLTFRVTDSLGKTATTTSLVNFIVYPTITATANAIVLQELEVGLAITEFGPLTASNGTGTYTYYIVSGTLPAGLTLNASTGKVTGTPTTAYSPANVRFGVQDSLGVVATTTINIAYTVFSRITASADTTARSFDVSTPITPFTPLTASNGTGIYTYYVSTGTLPGGLSINSSSGVVSGTTGSTPGTTAVTISVKDSFNVVASTTSAFNISYVGASVTVNYLVVGGGGGGGRGGPPGSTAGGGGGGGGGAMVSGSYVRTQGTLLTVTIGAGGVGGTGGASAASGGPGGTTLLTGATNAIGGGGGAGWNPSTLSSTGAGIPGASGGGGTNSNYPAIPGGYSPNPGGSGSAGYPGGSSGSSPGGAPFPNQAYGGGGGGGGGAGGSGANGTIGPSTFNPAWIGYGGAGGAGATWTYTGPTLYAGGGGGGSGRLLNPAVAGPSTWGKGGNGGGQPTGSSVAGSTADKGTVILAVPTPLYSGTKSGGTLTTPTAAPGQTVITYTSSGTYTV